MIPKPQYVQLVPGTFKLGPDTRMLCPEQFASVGAWLRSVLQPVTGFRFDYGDPGELTFSINADLADEEYRLGVGREGILIEAGRASGAFYGCQALLQLLPADVFRRSKTSEDDWLVPFGQIRDSPRFAWRGLMLDVARQFMPKYALLRLIDLMAVHRLNVLHLHLTDDQGWRVEIRKYPKLTEVGAWRRESQVGLGSEATWDGRPHGGYYSQDDLREIVEYAAQRFVQVVPEIDIPGHVQAALASYPELAVSPEPLDVSTRWGISPNVLNAEEATVQFFLDVLDEVVELFPSLEIGIGGDECLKDQWRADPLTQQRMIELGLTSEEELQGWFVTRMQAHLASRGRRLLAWDEVLEAAVPATTTIAAWRGAASAAVAAKRGHSVVSCPVDNAYLDYRQADGADEPIPMGIVLSLRDVYSFDPVPPGLSQAQAERVLGGQGNLWTENMDSPRVVDYFAFPRLCALSEALWSRDHDYEDFEMRLEAHLPRLEAMGVEYRRSAGPLPGQMRPGVPGKPRTRSESSAHFAELMGNIVNVDVRSGN